jgi:hypothetical protein
MVYAGSDEVIRPFTANAQTGRRIEVAEKNAGGLSAGKRIEFLKSAGHHFAPQRLPDGMSVVTAYQPEFFRIDPGMVDPTVIEFIAAPSIPWMEQHSTKFTNPDAIVDHVVQTIAAKGAARVKAARVVYDAAMKAEAKKPKVKPRYSWEEPQVPPFIPPTVHCPARKVLRDMIPLASLFAAYLDRRTRAPLVPDPRFQLQLLVACLEEGAAFMATESQHSSFRDRPWGEASSGMLYGYNLPQAGIWGALGFRAKHDKFQELLSEEVALYFAQNPA